MFAVAPLMAHAAFDHEHLATTTEPTFDQHGRRMMIAEQKCRNSDCKSSWTWQGVTYSGCPWNAPKINGAPACVTSFCPGSLFMLFDSTSGASLSAFHCNPDPAPPMMSPPPPPDASPSPPPLENSAAKVIVESGGTLNIAKGGTLNIGSVEP